MALKNSEYDAVMRRYDEIREKHLHIQEERTASVSAEIPEIEEIDKAAAELSFDAAKMRIKNPDADLSGYREALRENAGKKAALLVKAGYPADYLELTYDCGCCRDTGYVDGKRCSCFDRIASEILYGSGALSGDGEGSGLARFSFDLYSDTIIDETTGKTPREIARGAFSAAKEMLGAIGKADSSLYIYGNTGVGKTFLSRCIAEEAAGKGKTVLYFSAGDFFELLADAAFSQKERGDAGPRLVRECDLLIVDDLGTEMPTAFTASALFRMINFRLENNRSTIISSNLSLKELSEKYSERIFSRITSGYRIIRLTGSDIRIEKKLKKRNHTE